MLKVGATDSQMLDHFVRDGDHGAFRGLVSRHGPAVLQVCRGVLHDPHEAEDAFQATFLVLVRKAPLIKDPESLGGWLRGVAYRTAIRARCRAARRRALERTRAEMGRIEDFPDEIAPELRQMIREELERLPDTYRQAVVLCYLEGLTHQEAARKLGWPLGTVKIRLVRGRRLLRERLDRRGVGLGAGLLLLLLEPRNAKAVPQPLLDSTVRAMNLAKTGRQATLASEFARAIAMADSTLGAALGLKLHWLWPIVVLVAVFLGLTGLTGATVLAFHRPPAPQVDPSTLPSNLTNVLTIDCG
jgi:RNA polymerase sigma factor (sigma-70 family)